MIWRWIGTDLGHVLLWGRKPDRKPDRNQNRETTPTQIVRFRNVFNNGNVFREREYSGIISVNDHFLSFGKSTRRVYFLRKVTEINASSKETSLKRRQARFYARTAKFDKSSKALPQNQIRVK